MKSLKFLLLAFLISCNISQPDIYDIAESSYITSIEWNGEQTIIEWDGMESQIILTDKIIIGKIIYSISISQNNEILINRNVKWNGFDMDYFSPRKGMNILFSADQWYFS